MREPLLLLILCVAGTAAQGNNTRFEYAAVCPPSHRDDLTASGCDINILSSVSQNDVFIETFAGLEVLNVPANSPVVRTVDPSFHVDSGFEDKGIIISSREELVITVIKQDMETDNNQFVDAYQVFDQRLAGYEYFMLLKTQGCDVADYVKSFMTIVPFFDETLIQLYDQSGAFVGESIINRFQTFTIRTTMTDDDFSGMRVITEYATLAVAGSLCVGNSVTGEPESYITSLQPILFYGLEYVTPTIGGSPTSGYGLRVLAAETDTVVTHESNQNVLDKGEYWEIIYPTNEFATLFTCSKPCLVVQWSDGPDIGNFMFNVFALSQFTQIAQFVTLDFEGDNWLSIVVFGFPPMDDIFLDGDPLDDATWKVRSLYSYTELPIEPGVHLLNTINAKTFGAYVYCHFTDERGGYGYSVFPQDIENLPMPTTPESTVTIPTTTEIPLPREFEYIAVCPPSHRDDQLGSACNITFLSSVDNPEVKVSTYYGSELINLVAGVPYVRTVDPMYQMDEGLEYKGIVIEAYEEVVITVVKMDNDTLENRFIDTYQAYDRRFAGREYYIGTKTQKCIDVNYVNSFVSVMSFNDSTFVEVYDQFGLFKQASVLNRYQTFTIRSTVFNDDFSGMRIKLSEKSLVVTGSLCAGNFYDGAPESYVTSLQPTFLYGTEYVTPPIGGSLITGYGLRVIAAHDDTLVNHEGVDNHLDAGEYWEIQYNISSLATLFTCSNSCLVVQWSDGPTIGNFMFNVYAKSQYSMETMFHTMDFEGDHWVSIVVYGYPPFNDFYLDDRSLEDETWKVRAQYSYIELPLEPGVHIVHTTNADKTFSSYVYCHVNGGIGGYGYSVYPQGLDDVPIEPPYIVTTPDPSENYEYAVACPPHHRTFSPELSGCDVAITAAYEDALVNVSTVDSFMQLVVEYGSPFTLQLNHTFLTTEFVEPKAIIIVSTVELSVVIYKTDISGEDTFIDATQVYSLEMAGFEYFIMTETSGCANDTMVNSFYSLVGHWDSTFVRLYTDEQEFLEAIVLQRYQVYTLKSTDNSVQYSGIRINSIYPLTVYAGCLCVQNETTGVFGTYFTALMPVIHYATEYATPVVQTPTWGSYGVTVLAAADSTLVEYDGQTRVLQAGGSSSHNFLYNEYSSMVTCTKPCLIVQHTRSLTGQLVGNFQMGIVASDHFTRTAVFSTSERYAGFQHYLSIMVHGFPPMDDLLLDGVNLAPKTWKFRGEYTYVDFELGAGQHFLESKTAGKTFAAYVYCHTGNGGGFGYPVWPSGMLVGSTGSPPPLWAD